MANHETNWIVKLIDKVTAPAKSANAVTKQMSSIVKEVTSNLDKMGDEAKAAAEQALKSHGDLITLIKKEEREVTKLRRELKEAGDAMDPLSKGRIEFDIEQAQTKARRYKEQLVEIEQELKDVESGPDPEKMKAKWGEAVVVANQTMELIKGAIEGLDFTKDIDNLRGNIQLMTNESGKALDDLTAKVFKYSEIYKQSPDEMALAANAMTKQMGGTFTENLELIRQGFRTGANLNGDFLDQLKEYGPQMKEAGLSGAQGIAVMANAAKDGIFSDKAIDAIKEANLSLREMGQPQVDALAAIGIKVKDLAGKTSFEAMKMITTSMKGATTQARQLVLTDIFKGAGEDAGKGFIEGLSTMQMDINKLPIVEQTGEGITGWLADLKTSFSETFGGIGTTIVYLAPVITAVGTIIPLIKTLSEITWIQEAAQWALNIAMDANPVGLIIVGIAALIAMVVAAIKYYDDWGAALMLFAGPIGWVINLFQSFKRHWDSIVDAFKTDGIIAGLKRVGLVILDALLMPIQQLLELIAKIPGMGGVAGLGAAWIGSMRKKLDLVTPEEEANKKKAAEGKKEEEHKFKSLGGDAPKLDGKSTLTASTASSGGSSKIINMTLNVDNNFNVKDGSDFMKRKDEILDHIVGKLNDSMKDAIIATGA